MANKATGGQTSVEVPKAEGLVPRGGEGKLSVGGDDDVRDERVVAVEDSLGETVGGLWRRALSATVPLLVRVPCQQSRVLFAAGSSHLVRCSPTHSFLSPPILLALPNASVAHLIASQLPHDDRLVAGRGEDRIGVLRGGGDGGDPSRVADKGACMSGKGWWS